MLQRSYGPKRSHRPEIWDGRRKIGPKRSHCPNNRDGRRTKSII